MCYLAHLSQVCQKFRGGLQGRPGGPFHTRLPRRHPWGPSQHWGHPCTIVIPTCKSSARQSVTNEVNMLDCFSTIQKRAAVMSRLMFVGITAPTCVLKSGSLPQNKGVHRNRHVVTLLSANQCNAAVIGQGHMTHA